MSRVTEVSRSELEARRAAILDTLGLTMSQLYERAEAGALVAEEWEAWQTLRDILYLLGDD
jgi:hypothetical protein